MAISDTRKAFNAAFSQAAKEGKKTFQFQGKSIKVEFASEKKTPEKGMRGDPSAAKRQTKSTRMTSDPTKNKKSEASRISKDPSKSTSRTTRLTNDPTRPYKGGNKIQMNKIMGRGMDRNPIPDPNTMTKYTGQQKFYSPMFRIGDSTKNEPAIVINKMAQSNRVMPTTGGKKPAIKTKSSSMPQLKPAGKFAPPAKKKFPRQSGV